MICEFYTSYPPSVNDYYVRTRNGIHISNKGRKFRDKVIFDINEQLSGMDKIEGKVRVDVICWVPDNRKRDLDNLCKSIFDAITHAGIWHDDSQIDQVCLYRGAKVFEGRLYIKISEAAPIIPEGMEHLLDSGE